MSIIYLTDKELRAVVNFMKPKKRFVAGATCPSCKSEDTMRIWTQNGVTFRDCVECGFAEDNNILMQQNQQQQDAVQNNSKTDWNAKDKLIKIIDATAS